MQVFIVGTPLETAMVLDKRRLHKQIIEARQIIEALNGAKAWSNHPCVLQYRGETEQMWIRNYLDCLWFYHNGQKKLAEIESRYAELARPDWHCDEYFDQMKRRLYTKAPEHYKQWAHLGTSEENWYFVDGEWRKYVNGKRIE